MVKFSFYGENLWVKENLLLDKKFKNWYEECFDDYNEEEFMSFFSKVMEKCDEGYSLNNAFYYCQIDKYQEELSKEILNDETKD